MIRLTVRDGKIVQTLTLGADKIFIGRLEGNTIRLEDASVSRKHALLRRSERGDYEVLDLNSSRGTQVNGRPVDRSPVAIGDEVRFGDVRVRVEALDGIAPPPAAEAIAAPKRLSRLLRGFRPPAPGAAAGPTAAAAPAPVSLPAKALISDGHRTSFSEEMYRQIRRTPWWAASLFAHVFLLFLIMQMRVATPLGDDGLGEFQGRLQDDLFTLKDPEPPKPEPMRRTESPDVEPFPSLPVERASPVAEPLPPLPPPPMVAPPVLGPSSMDFSRAPPLASPLVNPAVPDSEFGQEGAVSANEKAGELIRQSLLGRPGDLMGLLERLDPEEILVVSGHYDKAESVLELLQIPRRQVTLAELSATRLTGRKAVLVNCTNERADAKAIDRLRDYVAGGGYLLTTDWGVENVLKHAFPGYLAPLLGGDSRNVTTADEVVDIHLGRDGRDHFLLEGIPVAAGGARWWLEESSYPLRILKRDAVEILVESNDLAKRYEGGGVVAATFRYGKGRVLHMLGHFYQKEGNLKGTVSSQRLLANFLVSAVRHR